MDPRTIASFFARSKKTNSYKKTDGDEGEEMVSMLSRPDRHSTLQSGMVFRVVTQRQLQAEQRALGGAPETQSAAPNPVVMSDDPNQEPFKQSGDVIVDMEEQETKYLVVENNNTDEHIWVTKMQVSTFALVICIGIGVLGMIMGGVIVGFLVNGQMSDDHLSEKGFAIVVNLMNKLMKNETIACEVSYVVNNLCNAISDEFIPILGSPLQCNFKPSLFGFPEDFQCQPLPYFYGTVDGSELASILSSHSGFYEQLSALKKLNKNSDSSSET